MKFFDLTSCMFKSILLIIFQFMIAQNLIAQCSGNLQTEIHKINPCAHDGQLSVTVNNGTPPFTYEWVNYGDPSFTGNTQTIQNLKPGYYGLTVRDAAGNCNSTQEIYLPAPFFFNVATSPEICPNQDGSAEVTTITGGTLPYTFLWNTGATTQKITQMKSGSYQVTVIDGNGCLAEYGDNGQRDSLSIQIEQLNDIVTDIVMLPATCTFNSGSLSISVLSGGTPPFTYVWSNYQNQQTWNTASIQNVGGNAYYGVTVTDAVGCFIQKFEYVPKLPSFSVASTTTQDNCGKSTGTATVTANDSNGPYTYLWSNGVTTQTNTNLSSGFYTVTVTNSNLCEEVSSAYVLPYSPVQIDYSLTHEICAGHNGTIQVIASAGTPPYAYAWSHGPTTANVSGLSAGNYVVTVTDAVGCFSFKYIYISDTPHYNVSLTTTEERCQDTKGSATIVVTGGTAPYTYQWSHGPNTSQVTNLDAGYYTCTISDATGCTTVQGANIVRNSQIYAYLSQSPENCSAGDGSLTIFINGSNPPFTYLWNHGQTTQNVGQLSSGNYTVTITDTKGCQLIKSEYVARTGGSLNASILTTPASCLFNQDGQAEALVSGGTPPYQYQWGNGGQTSIVTGLKPYFGIGLIVTDASGCMAHKYVPTIGFNNFDCAGIIRGRVVLDENSNCMIDGNDSGLENVMVSCVPSPQGLAFTNASGHYQYYVPKNTEHLLTQHHGYLFPVCPTSSVIVPPLASGQMSDQNNFYNDPAQIEDLVISMGYSIPPRPGFPFELIVNIENKGLFKANGQATISYNQSVNYIAGGTNHDPALKEIYLNFNDLPAFTGSQKFTLRFETPASVPLGTIQKYVGKVTPILSDASKHNNEETIRVEVVGSYDPNDKSVTLPNGLKSDCLTKQDSILKYTIRFQNTGNFPASFVIIQDTLHPNLEYTSLRGGASSHPYRMQFLPDGYLHFVFDPIFLPDSTTDESNSHGFVTYYISPKKTIAEDDWIYNTAAIYFDFNEPIITNTTSILTCRSSSTDEPLSLTEITIHPNPVSTYTTIKILSPQNESGKLELFSITGQIIRQWPVQTQSNEFMIQLNTLELPGGQYSIRYTGKNGVVTKMMVKQ